MTNACISHAVIALGRVSPFIRYAHARVAPAHLPEGSSNKKLEDITGICFAPTLSRRLLKDITIMFPLKYMVVLVTCEVTPL